ncbi:MAG: hypothetical protein EKK53_25820 [Burkholderiales bacterium]|nr:MAG: hypothetical protein EKK53_25820 [Burkholderiales bacterium]
MILTSLIRPTVIGACLGLHLAAHAAPAAPAEVRFDTTPRAGQQQRQFVDMQATMTMRVEAGPEATDEQRAKVAQMAERMAAQGGPIKMSMGMSQTTRVGQPDADGWLPLSLTSSDRKTTVEVGSKAVPMPKEAQGDMIINARFNPRDFAFEVKDVAGSAPGMEALMTTQGQAMLADAFKLHKALAQRSLKVGESVDVPMSLSLPVPLPGGAGAMQGQIHYTLVRVERGVAYFDLSMTLNANLETPLPPAPAASGASAPESATAPRTLRVVMNGQATGTSALRLTDRLPLTSRMAMTMKASFDGPDNTRMLMDMDMTMQSKGESLGLRTAPAKKKS